MASRAPLRAARSPQGPRGRAAPAATGRAALPSAGCCPLPPGHNSSSRPRLLLLLLLLLQDAGAQQGDGCGHTVLGPESGTLTSINYPNTYPNSTVCKWEIRVKTGERIRIKFGDFDIEDSDYCHLNYLKIYNGIGVSRMEIDTRLLNRDSKSQKILGRCHKDPKKTKMATQAIIPSKTLNYHKWRNQDIP